MAGGPGRGELVEDFELPDQGGVPRRLSGWVARGPVVLFFYPAALTRGCTAQSCHFRDLGAEFARVGAQRVGISPDPPARQAEFAGRHGLDYPLLSDVDGVVIDRFGARRRGSVLPLPATRRVTFVIGVDSRVVEVIRSEVSMNAHADRALRALGG